MRLCPHAVFQSPFLTLCDAGLFDICRQSPREVLHLLLYNVFRPFANAVHSRYLNSEGQEEFSYRLKAVRLARGWASITFNLSVDFDTIADTLTH